MVKFPLLLPELLDVLDKYHDIDPIQNEIKIFNNTLKS